MNILNKHKFHTKFNLELVASTRNREQHVFCRDLV